MISIKFVLKIHKGLILEFGGTDGVRDIGFLESALSRPFQTFNGKELYPGIEEKAAALIESIVNNHPFVDGNKRTGYTIMNYFLFENGLLLDANGNEKYEFVINIASGKLSFQKIVEWLQKHTK